MIRLPLSDAVVAEGMPILTRDWLVKHTGYRSFRQRVSSPTSDVSSPTSKILFEKGLICIYKSLKEA